MKQLLGLDGRWAHGFVTLSKEILIKVTHDLTNRNAQSVGKLKCITSKVS